MTLEMIGKQQTGCVKDVEKRSRRRRRRRRPECSSSRLVSALHRRLEKGVDHLTNAIAVCGQPQQLLQVLQQTLPPPVFQMLLTKLPSISQRIVSAQSLSEDDMRTRRRPPPSPPPPPLPHVDPP
ncbi:mitochondrial import receptor subunit TOM20 homolog [Pseudoliparis swirei]|uniref:mitochondrial import receptor subunit TOM20 homolog n=1 Tax=Pseudoliparis swirei TaxID=2059687 RepID=UPI0024BE8870|nr:mitochondrial import receptor subunit TOM20 homolog [Pseudoliparis swirei]